MLKKVILAARSKDGYEELRWATRQSANIELFLGDFADHDSYDCVATAGNGFGLMDAGMDLAIVRKFGIAIQDRIQETILKDFLGEQPVGSSIIVPTGNGVHRYVAHAPTMRTPMNIVGTDHVYLATWATLLAVHQLNRHDAAYIESLLLPAFGTGTGGMTHLEAGTQIKLAVDNYFNPPTVINPVASQERSDAIHYGGKYGFENPRPIT